MNIRAIAIENFRLLKNFRIELSQTISLVVGKNNTGKTSLVAAVEKFTGTGDFRYDDLNIAFRSILSKSVLDKVDDPSISIPRLFWARFEFDYTEDDDISILSELFSSLEPNYLGVYLDAEVAMKDSRLEKAIGFLSTLSKKDRPIELQKMFRDDFASFCGKVQYSSASVDHSGATPQIAKTIRHSDADFKVGRYLGFSSVAASRDVSNNENDKLSRQTSSLYRRAEISEEHQALLSSFKERLSAFDENLTGLYTTLFDDVVKTLASFGGATGREGSLRITSSLDAKNILDNNTKLMYAQSGQELPEYRNGLGYMNLISMILRLDFILGGFVKETRLVAPCVRLLFVEEPEAHTHPQMQYLFIHNIKELLSARSTRADKSAVSMQTLLSTHSSHILSEADFDDVKYLQRVETDVVIAKSLASLASEYKDDKAAFAFLKQYLTLTRSELFFADKAILFEGDTERLLIPAAIRKLDIADPLKDGLQLGSQNVSLVEVGAYSHIFEIFLDFLGIKTLVITDIDTYKRDPSDPKETVGCPASDPDVEGTTNSSLLKFFEKERKDISFFMRLKPTEKILEKVGKSWKTNPKGRIRFAFQTEENGYWARSFEDSFLNLNKAMLFTHKDVFKSIRKSWLDRFEKDPSILFEFSEKGITSKPSFAIEVLIAGSQEKDNSWFVPGYIVEGLKWLRAH